MIPQKAGTDPDLNAQIDKDLQKAEEQQKEIAKKKPKLAQAVASKWAKYIIIGSTAIGIAYKMFFAPTPEDPKKKTKKTNKVAKTANNKSQKEQQKMADQKVAKTANTGVAENTTDVKEIIGLDEQTMANSEALAKVAVPKLELPEVPTLPAIEKITIKEEQKTIAQPTKSDTNKYEEIEEEVIENGKKVKKTVRRLKSTTAQSLPNDQEEKSKPNEQSEIKKKRKIKKKIRDKKGKIKTITEEIEMTDKEYEEYKQRITEKNFDSSSDLKKPEEELPKQPLSATQRLQDKTDSNTEIEKSKNIGKHALEEMFILNGAGPRAANKQTSQSGGKKDFILFDGASLSEKQVVSANASNNVTTLSNLENTIASGKIMEGVLETAINSESAGTIRAVVSKDVYGEAGNKILIPRGSRLYGSYTTTTKTVQGRLLLTWNKVIRPDGVVITMNADTYDQSGRKGIEGDIDTKYGELFKNALLYSFVTLGTAIAVEKVAGIKNSTSINTTSGTSVTNTSPANAAATSVIDTAQDIAEKMTDGLTDDLNPVISIPQGTLLEIMTNTDIVINSAYKRRTQDIKID